MIPNLWFKRSPSTKQFVVFFWLRNFNWRLGVLCFVQDIIDVVSLVVITKQGSLAGVKITIRRRSMWKEVLYFNHFFSFEDPAFKNHFWNIRTNVLVDTKIICDIFWPILDPSPFLKCHSVILARTTTPKVTWHIDFPKKLK